MEVKSEQNFNTISILKNNCTLVLNYLSKVSLEDYNSRNYDKINIGSCSSCFVGNDRYYGTGTYIKIIPDLSIREQAIQVVLLKDSEGNCYISTTGYDTILSISNEQYNLWKGIIESVFENKALRDANKLNSLVGCNL